MTHVYQIEWQKQKATTTKKMLNDITKPQCENLSAGLKTSSNGHLLNLSNVVGHVENIYTTLSTRSGIRDAGNNHIPSQAFL